MKNIAVIGAGTMGNGIAHTFAQYNFNVQLIDISQKSLDRSIAVISKNLDRLVSKDKITATDKDRTLANITTFTSIKEGTQYASLVIEAATENLELKLKIFKELDEVCPDDTILATNTSSISITQIAAVTSRPDKVIGMHFMNPVPIMSLVEIINSKHTSKTTTEIIIEISEKLEKIPLTVNDYPGFISNRILMPMINEAIEALEDGVSTVKNIDGIMKLGMNHPMGPLQLADLIGLDVCKSILEVMFKGINKNKYVPNKLLIELVEDGKLGVKSGEGFYDYSNSKKAEIVSKRFC